MTDLGGFLKMMAGVIGVFAFILAVILLCARAGENFGFTGVVLMLCACSIAAYCIGGVLVGLNRPMDIRPPPP